MIRRGFLGALTAALLMRPGRRVAVAPQELTLLQKLDLISREIRERHAAGSPLPTWDELDLVVGRAG